MRDRDDILTGAANGNADALAFLRAFARRAHWVDDLADRDKLDQGPDSWYSPEDFAREEAAWLIVLSGNPFFLAHRAQLVPAMVLALSAWVDSHKFPPGQQSVLKAQWHEVVWLVAWLTGGWNSIRNEASNREFDLEIPIHGTGYAKEYYSGKDATASQPMGDAIAGQRYCGCTSATVCPECEEAMTTVCPECAEGMNKSGGKIRRDMLQRKAERCPTCECALVTLAGSPFPFKGKNFCGIRCAEEWTKKQVYLETPRARKDQNGMPGK